MYLFIMYCFVLIAYIFATFSSFSPTSIGDIAPITIRSSPFRIVVQSNQKSSSAQAKNASATSGSKCVPLSSRMIA